MILGKIISQLLLDTSVFCDASTYVFYLLAFYFQFHSKNIPNLADSF